MTGIAEHPGLIIGGAGFSGTNLTAHLTGRGIPVRSDDDLSRPGVELHLAGQRVDRLPATVFRLSCVRTRYVHPAATLRQDGGGRG